MIKSRQVAMGCVLSRYLHCTSLRHAYLCYLELEVVLYFLTIERVQKDVILVEGTT